MQYHGKHRIFDTGQIRTYPVNHRPSRVQMNDLVNPQDLLSRSFNLTPEAYEKINLLAQAIYAARRDGKPVIVFTGAHLIKNGLGLVLVDLLKRGFISLLAGNGATAIHDFELALIGATSEDVPNALGSGQFGMAYEFAYINQAIRLGYCLHLGLGEALGQMICCQQFQRQALAELKANHGPVDFQFPKVSVLANCHQLDIPFTVHVGIGTDVIDQHPSFDPAAKGACSGRDFLIFTDHISRLTSGGVFLNIGSAVTGPEVLLKAVSMASNSGRSPKGLVTADFDLRAFDPSAMADECAPGYYLRDQKSVVSRIPQAFSGQGYYIQGNQLQTIPALYSRILEKAP